MSENTVKEKQVEMAKVICEQRNCAKLDCKFCPAHRRFNDGDNCDSGFWDTPNSHLERMDDEQIGRFEAFIAKHDGPAKRKAPTHSRSVSEICNDIEYKKDEIDGLSIEEYTSEMQKHIDERDEKNKLIKEYRARIRKHKSLDEAGRLD